MYKHFSCVREDFDSSFDSYLSMVHPEDVDTVRNCFEVAKESKQYVRACCYCIPLIIVVGLKSSHTTLKGM